MDFRFITVAGTELSAKALPRPDVTVTPTQLDQNKVRLLQRITCGQSILEDSVFREFVEKIGYESVTPVVATSGIPAPYDAWTGPYEGHMALYFNLDQFSEGELIQKAIPILKHEITHIVLYPLLIQEPIRSFRQRLERIVFDEGIAHFMGFVGDRTMLLRDFGQRWTAAEDELRISFARLDDPKETLQQKENLLTSADTGPY